MLRPPRPVLVLLLASLLTLPLTGCLGGRVSVNVDCGNVVEATLGGLPFSHQVNSGDREGRTVWMWTMVTSRACEAQEVVVRGTVRVAPPQAAFAHCPTADATVALSTAAASEQGTRDAPAPRSDGGDAVFELESRVDVRKVGHSTGVIAIVEILLPKVDDPAKARECALDRVKQVELSSSFYAPKD